MFFAEYHLQTSINSPKWVIKLIRIVKDLEKGQQPHPFGLYFEHTVGSAVSVIRSYVSELEKQDIRTMRIPPVIEHDFEKQTAIIYQGWENQNPIITIWNQEELCPFRDIRAIMTKVLKYG